MRLSRRLRRRPGRAGAPRHRPARAPPPPPLDSWDAIPPGGDPRRAPDVRAHRLLEEGGGRRRHRRVAHRQDEGLRGVRLHAVGERHDVLLEPAAQEHRRPHRVGRPVLPRPRRGRAAGRDPPGGAGRLQHRVDRQVAVEQARLGAHAPRQGLRVAGQGGDGGGAPARRRRRVPRPLPRSEGRGAPRRAGEGVAEGAVRRALFSALLSLVACRLDVDPSGTFRCDDNHACPAGYDCVDGCCALPPADAGPDPDAGAASGCGKMSLLSDDFESEGEPSFWWSLNEPDGVSQVGGELILSPLPDEAESYPQYFSNPSYDLLGSSVTVEVPQSVHQADGVYASLTAQVGGGEMVAISQENGRLWVLRVEGGLFDAIEGAEYSPDDHRFWRLRDDGEHMFAEASPDGDGDWVVLASLDSDPLFRYAHVMLEAGTYEAVADPGSAHFDDLNPAGASGEYCKLDTFTDEFDDGETDPAWLTGSYVVNGASFEENSGLRIELGDATGSEGIYISAPRFDMRD